MDRMLLLAQAKIMTSAAVSEALEESGASKILLVILMEKPEAILKDEPDCQTSPSRCPHTLDLFER